MSKRRTGKGRNGYVAKVKGDAIIIVEWLAGVKQDHMQMAIPLAQWPMGLGWCAPNPALEGPGIYRRSVNDFYVANLNYVHFEICQAAIVEMARRVFNEEWGPHMARMADAIRKAIYRVLPDSAPADYKASKAHAKKAGR